MKKAVLVLFILTLVGCGKGKSGIILKVTTDTTGIAQAKPRFAAIGDQNNDFPDRFLTPSAFTVAFKSFKLIKEDDTDPSYTLFDNDFSNPLVVSLTTGETLQVAADSSTPTSGTYSQISYEVSYLEMIVPIYGGANGDSDRHNKRLRFYLTSGPDPNLNNFTATAFDILLSQSDNGFDFGWISKALGLSLTSLTSFPITGQRPLDALQVPSTQFPSNLASPLFKITLTTPLVIPDKATDKFVFTLNFDLTDLFFYDNTDEGGGDPGPDYHFNALVDDQSISRDGKFLYCPVPCPTSNPDSADFWPGLPNVTVSASTQPS